MLVTVHDEACCSRSRGMAQGGDVGCLLNSKERLVVFEVLCPVALINGVSWSLLYRHEPRVGCQAVGTYLQGTFAKKPIVLAGYMSTGLCKGLCKIRLHCYSLWRWLTGPIAACKECL